MCPTGFAFVIKISLNIFNIFLALEGYGRHCKPVNQLIDESLPTTPSPKNKFKCKVYWSSMDKQNVPTHVSTKKSSLQLRQKTVRSRPQLIGYRRFVTAPHVSSRGTLWHQADTRRFNVPAM